MQLLESVNNIVIAIFLVSIYAIYRYLHKKYLYRKMNMPYVKNGYPFFGQVFEMLVGSPWDKMAKWAQEYGPVYRIHLFGSDAICISDPELLKIVLHTKFNIFKKDLKWTYKPFLPLLGNGIVTSDGVQWRNRRLLLSAHLRVNILEDVPQMAYKAFHRLSLKLHNAKQNLCSLDMSEEFRHLTLQVIAEAVLSLSPDESDKTFAKMYLPIVEEGNKRTWNPERMYLPTPSWFRFNKNVAILNNYVTKLINERIQLRAKSEMNDRIQDVLDKILGSIPHDQYDKNNLSQIRDEIKTFILAGHETSASALTWALFELVQNHPGHLQRVKEEAFKVFRRHYNQNSGKMETFPSFNELQEGLVFTECCLREALRKYSSVPSVVRTASEATTIGCHFVPKGMTVMINIQGVHHNPELWPDPHTFNPERFLTQNQPYSFLAFIEGPRMCLGQYLSILETKIILSLLIMNFSLEIVNPSDASIRHPYMIPIIPKFGHHIRVLSNQ